MKRTVRVDASPIREPIKSESLPGRILSDNRYTANVPNRRQKIMNVSFKWSAVYKICIGNNMDRIAAVRAVFSSHTAPVIL